MTCGEHRRHSKSDLFSIIPAGKIAVFGSSFFPSFLVFLGAAVQPRTRKAYFAPTCYEQEFISPGASGPQLSGLDKDTGIEGQACFAVWQMLPSYNFWMPFVPDL